MELEQVFRAMVDFVCESVFIVDKQLKIEYLNAAAEKMTGWKNAELKGRTCRDFFTEVMPGMDLISLIMHAVNGGKTGKFGNAIRIYKKDGTYRDVQAAILQLHTEKGIDGIALIAGEAVTVDVGIHMDETLYEACNQLAGTEQELKNVYRKDRLRHLRYLSFHDSLTGLYNRAYFEEELARLDSGRNLPFSLIVGDMNCLKLMNDVFGHNEGDRALVGMARILKRYCRKDDVVVRWGGDEFAIILPSADTSVASRICERIKEACSCADGYQVKLSVALGHATKDNAAQDASQILREAEDSMYSDKLAGRNSIRDMIIKSLKLKLFERGLENERHISCMKSVCEKIGRAVELDENEISRLSLLAEYHDIGNVALPDEVLLKKDRLSDKEWKIIMKHPEIGYRIAEYSPELCNIADAILSHHERYDGRGYPQGLKQDAIPVIARIAAISDTYAALVSERVYKQSVEADKALREIEKNAGSQFDPYLVKVFAAILEGI